MLYMYFCGANQNTVSEDEFLAGCNRFAIDNPVPTITARLAWYGNEDNSTKQVLEQFEKRIND